MGITANSGPFVSFGLTHTSTGGGGEYNEERGPSLWDLGQGTLDPRSYFNYDPGSPVGTKIYGFFGGRAAVDFVPFAPSTNAIAAAQAPVAGTALTLVTTGSTKGAFYTTITAPETGASATVVALDSTAAYLTFGSGGTVAVWNPAAGAGRTINIVVTSTGRDTGGVTVAGRDVYGIKMTETIPFGSTQLSSFAGVKAFKYISAVTPLASASFVSTGIIVGFNDTFGLPLVANYSGIDTSVRIIATSSLVGQNSSGPITVASTVATATSTTPDARGTYASTTASNSVVRLQISQNITAAMVNGITATSFDSMFGIAQYSSV